jgi:regulator of sigma E protease
LALSFLVLLNINLAILNLLPIPVLDGGHIVMSILEKIRRRPLNVKLVEYVTTGFAVLLISFILFVSFNDLTRHLSIFTSRYKQNTKIEQPGKSNDAAEPAAREK